MLGLFKQKNPANFILLLVFGILIKLPVFREHPVPAETPGDGVLYRWLLDAFSGKNPPPAFLFPAFSTGLLFIQALLLNRLISRHRMMNRQTWLPGMSFLLITSLFPEWNFFSAPLIVNTFLLYILSALFRIYNQPSPGTTIFNTGLALGISVFIFFPSLFFGAWILIALMVMRPFRMNEWLIGLLGIMTPFYFYGIWLFIKGAFTWQAFFPPLHLNMPDLEQSLWLAAGLFLLTIPFLIGSYYVQDSLRKMLIQVRKGWSLVLFYLLVAVLVAFVNSTGNLSNWVLAAVPFAAFHACTYLYSGFRIIPVLFFWLSLAYILAYQYAGPGW